MSKTLWAILVLFGAALLWYGLKVVASVDADAALDLGKKYLGFATALAGVLGIANGGSSLLKGRQDEVLTAMTTTATGLSVTLAGGAMVGGDPLVPAAALVAGGLVGAVYLIKKC